MQKVSYMGDGTTTEFAFNFPYYENTNITVNKNGTTASGYTIIGTSAGQDADIPYTGGKVVFETAPTSFDNIIIARHLPLVRTVDYQPTAKIEPTTLNQDINYLMEVLKDLKDEFDTLHTQYTEIADKDSTTALLARITAIHDEIVSISAQISALGDISQIRNDITTLQTTTNNLVNNPKYTTPNLSQSVSLNDGDTLPCDAFVYWIGSGMGNWKNIGIVANGTTTFAVASLYTVQMGVFLPRGTTITKTDGTSSVQYFPLN